MCRNITFAAAVSSLLQAAACIAFGVVAMLMFECKLTPIPPDLSDPTNLPSPLVAFANTFYLQYFHSKNNCIAHNVEFWRDVNDTQTGVVTKSYQVHGMFIGYLVENSIWFLLSFLLLFNGVMKSKWVYVTYASTQFTVILYDAILIVLFGLDFKSYKEFQGNTNVPWITKTSMLINIIVMMLIVSRFVVFFIVNIIFSSLVQKFISNLSKSKKSHSSGKSKKSRKSTPPVNPVRDYPGSHQEPYQSQNYPQEQFNQGPMRASSRYPDVVGSPGLVHFHDNFHSNPAVRYGSPARQPVVAPVMGQYPRYQEDHRQKNHDNRAAANDRQKPLYYPNYESSSSEGQSAHYFNEPPRKVSYQAPQYQEDRKRQATSPSNLQPRSNDVNGFANNTRGAPVRRRSSDRSSMNEELKNQRPWSYIYPDDNNPSSKFNQLNPNINKEKATSTRVLTSVEEYDSDDHNKYPSQKRKYYANHSVESEEPLLTRAPLYANVELPAKKNVRFSKRTQSLDYLSTAPSSSPAAVHQRQKSVKSPKNDDKRRLSWLKRRNSREFDSSGDELCTDEFFIRYENKSPTKQTVKKTDQKSKNKKNSRSSASSPNLIVDSATNTATIVFGDRPNESDKSFKSCRRQGASVIHVLPCDGLSCQRSYLNETSL